MPSPTRRWLTIILLAGTACLNGPAQAATQQVSAGGSHTVALDWQGKIWSWGYNAYGQLGNGTVVGTTAHPVAAQVAGLTGANVSGGFAQTLALLPDGTLRAWGLNNKGQLGNGGIVNSALPVTVSGATGISAISNGRTHALALRTDGTVWAVGENGGRLGTGASTPTYVTTPVAVTGLAGITISAIAAGGFHSIALDNTGTVWTWGGNTYGQLGNGTPIGNTTQGMTPTAVPGLGNVIAIAAGNTHSVAVKSDGTVWTWGLNTQGQLGIGSTDTSATAHATPAQVLGLTGITAVAAGSDHTLARKSDGTVLAWGANLYGQLGYATGTAYKSNLAQPVAALSGIAGISAGVEHSVALGADGWIWSWGRNNFGQLGLATPAQSTVPLKSINLAPPDTAPDAFSFTAQSGVALNTVITSNAITVSGVNSAAPISITGCTSGDPASCAYNINNSATWLTAASTVANGNTVKVRQKSAATSTATSSVTLGIGGVSGSFSITTGTAGTLQLDSPSYSVNEGIASVTLNVTRAGGSLGAASVSYATANGSATAGSDYTAKTGTLSWAAGDATAKTIVVSIANDTTVESAETFTVTLSNPVGAALGATTSATVTIADTDGNLQFDAATASVNESAGTLTLNVTRTGSTTGAASVKYASAVGTATAADFTATSGTLNWAAGDAGSKTITVPIANDALVEALETFSVTLSTPTGAALGTASKSTVTIVDNDSAFQFSAATAALNESAGTVTLNVTRTAGAGAVVDAASVGYTSANGTATAGGDYTATSGTLSWGAGVLGTQSITVPITDDTLVEAAETFTVTLANPVGAILGSAKTATVTLADNDSNLQFSAPTYGVSEGLATLTLSVTRTGSLAGTATVDYASADGTALAGSDYTAASGTLTWAAGTGGAKSIVIPISADALVEGNETFSVTLTNPVGATPGATDTTTVTITDNDSLLQFSAPSYIVGEAGANVVLTVNRVGSPALAASISYATSDGTAAAGSDYTAKSGILSWAANDATAKTITIPVTNDAVTEGSETFSVTLTNPTSAILGDPTVAGVTIVDNEAAPAGGIQFSAAEFLVKEDDGNAVLTVSRTGDTSAAATVNYATTAGSATTTDFTAKSGTVTWAAGDGADKTILIPLTNDTVAEGAEAFTVTLSNAAGAALGAQVKGTAWIADDDDAFPRYGMMPAGLVKPAAANNAWQVSSEQFMTGGIYSLRSGTIGDNQTAGAELTGAFQAGNVSFALKTSSEATFDALVFYVDGVEKGRWSGIQAAWTTVSYSLTAGAHTLTWSYEKDGSGANGADAAWVDSVSLPPAL